MERSLSVVPKLCLGTRLAKRRFAPRAGRGLHPRPERSTPASAEGQSPKNKPLARIAALRRHAPENGRSPSAQKSPHNHRMHRQRPMRPQNQRLLNIRRPRRPANQARPPRQQTRPLPHPRPNRLHIRQNILRPQNRQMQRRQQTRRQRMPAIRNLQHRPCVRRRRNHPRRPRLILVPRRAKLRRNPPPAPIQPRQIPRANQPQTRTAPPQPRRRRPRNLPHPLNPRRSAGIPLRRPRKPRNQTPSFRIRKKPPRKCLPSLAAARNPSRLPFRKNRLPAPQTPQNLRPIIPQHHDSSRHFSKNSHQCPPSAVNLSRANAHSARYSSALHAPRNR